MDYTSFGPWDPKDEDFQYDTEPLTSSGFKIRARLDKRNPDLQKLVEDLGIQERDVKTIEVEPGGVYVDVWSKQKET